MPKRSSKKASRDVNVLAASIVEQVTGKDALIASEIPQKNPAAIALGRLGGKKGGPARAKKLSPEQRREIARRAALARWSRK